MARTTKKELESLFTLWLERNGFPKGYYQTYERFDGSTGSSPRPGYILDYAPAYGGYRVEYLLENTGHQTPFGHERHSASEMAAMLRFSIATDYEHEQQAESLFRTFPAS